LKHQYCFNFIKIEIETKLFTIVTWRRIAGEKPRMSQNKETEKKGNNHEQSLIHLWHQILDEAHTEQGTPLQQNRAPFLGARKINSAATAISPLPAPLKK
jgi:hypothetical protein